MMKETNYLDMELLRFTTAGSVDDGKSTLIGRLLYDSKSIFEDQLDAVSSSSKRKGLENLELALLTDGLRDEREQGITIDVAYRYFATPKRKFIIADTPGHIQYTRNMVTGASTANLALILVDARKGVIEQTLRHSYIASLLGIAHVVVCVNKMDLVDYEEDAFLEVAQQYTKVNERIGLQDVSFIPISALKGDNVVNASEAMPWYSGPTLMEFLENLEIQKDADRQAPRFQIQTVIRPHSDEWHDYRGYAGRVSGGRFGVGDEVRVVSSGLKSTIKGINLYSTALDEALANMSVALTLTDDIDISRGDVLTPADEEIRAVKSCKAMICWLMPESPKPRAKFIFRQGAADSRALISVLNHHIDINTLQQSKEESDIKMNDIVNVDLKLSQAMCLDAYHQNKHTGSFVLIDESTNETVAAGMVL